MCKGADSIMLPRCDFSTPQEKEDEVNISQELLNFAKEGLRTLVVAQKTLNETEFKQFNDAFTKLKISTYADKEKKLNNLYDKYE
jgi:phospholipid-translocating ATPase